MCFGMDSGHVALLFLRLVGPPQHAAHESHEFTGDRGDGLIGVLPGPQQMAESAVEPLMRLVGVARDHGRLPFAPLLQRTADSRRLAVVMGDLTQDPADMAIAGLGDSAAPRPSATRQLAGHEPHPTHQVTRRDEARNVVELGYQNERCGGVDAVEAA